MAEATGELADLIPVEHRRLVAIVPIGFIRDHEDDPAKPGTLREVHKVEWAKKGGNGMTHTEKIERLRKGAIAASKMDAARRIQNQDLLVWSVIEPHYNAWLKGQEVPSEGTPVQDWPGLTRGQADKFKAMHLTTVEAVADMTDNDCDHFGMGGRVIRDRARAFVGAKNGAASAGEVAALRQRLEERDADIAELRAMLDELTKPKVEEAKRGPGRPRKVLTEEDEAA